MREDLTRHGVLEARTADDVDRLIAENGTLLMVVNSVCGCAAGKARPAVGLALEHSTVKPDAAATVFAGADVAATTRLREKHLPGMPTSSPSMALFRDGKVVWVLHRFEIETRVAPQIAEALVEAFGKHCANQPA